MSSPKRRHLCTCDGTAAFDSPPAPPALPPSIPVDLLLEIFARTDANTVVRCVATSKPIRRAVLEAAGGGGGFRPGFLLGVSYVYSAAGTSTWTTYVYQQSRHHLGFDAGLLVSYKPVASRGGLVALRGRWGSPGRLPSVYDSLTGRRLCHLPPASVQCIFPPAFLDVGGGGRSFQLLIADRSLRTQVFSSEHGTWGDVVETLPLPPRFSDLAAAGVSQALVLGRTAAHWLSFWQEEIIYLDVGAARATVIKLPPKCLERVRVRSKEPLDMKLQLAASPDGRLGLLAAESYAISMWTLSAAPEEHGPSPASSSAPLPAARWTRRTVIKLHEISREWLSYSAHFLAFGERSGAVVMQVDGVGLVLLNLRSKDAPFIVLIRESTKFKRIIWVRSALELCLHEGDLFSVLQAMKHY